MILLQETHSQKTGRNMAIPIASLLRMKCITFERSQTAILSRKKITKIDEGSRFGIGRIGRMYYCVTHLQDAPYLPFASQRIPYPPECRETNCFYSRDPQVLVRRSLEVRGPELRELIESLSRLPKRAKVIAGGDFNEPSHLDWTQDAVKRGEVPLAIKFPCTRVMEGLGFVDTYRSVNDDLGYTWPDREVEYDYRPDRIDFIFAKDLEVVSSEVVVTGLSDHAIVIAELNAD